MLLVPPIGWPSGSDDLYFTLVAQSYAASSTITIPLAGRVAGNVAIVFNWSTGSSPAAVSLSGFTPLWNSALGSVARSMGWFKILNGTETTLSGMNDTAEFNCVLVFQPSKPVVYWYGGAAYGNQATTSNPSPQTINFGATGLPPPYLAFALLASSGSVSASISPSTMTLASGVPAGFRPYFQIVNPGETPTSISVDMNDGGNNIMTSGFLVFTEVQLFANYSTPGSYTWTVPLDATSVDVSVRGGDGEDGEDGEDGTENDDGNDGDDGANGGASYFDPTGSSLTTTGNGGVGGAGGEGGQETGDPFENDPGQPGEDGTPGSSASRSYTVGATATTTRLVAGSDVSVVVGAGAGSYVNITIGY